MRWGRADHEDDQRAREKTRPDRIDAVAIVTPNFAHHEVAKVFLGAGFHVICDKPVTTSLATALDLAEMLKRTGMIFGLTHNYSGYPMVRQALAKWSLPAKWARSAWCRWNMPRTGSLRRLSAPARSKRNGGTRRAAAPRDALATLALTLTISPPLSPACNVRSSPPISRFSCRDGSSMTTFTSCCGIVRVRAACCGRARLRPATRIIYGCAYTASGLPKIAPAPEFSLTSQDGGQVTLAVFRGRVVVVTFIYTLCTTTCPVLTPMMSFVQDQLGPNFGTRIVFVSITVDPERDTPEVLKEYAQAFGANLAGWAFLTGNSGRHSGGHASLRCVRVEDRERRRGAHVSYIHRGSAWNPASPVCRSALRPGRVPP